MAYHDHETHSHRILSTTVVTSRNWTEIVVPLHRDLNTWIYRQIRSSHVGIKSLIRIKYNQRLIITFLPTSVTLYRCGLWCILPEIQTASTLCDFYDRIEWFWFDSLNINSTFGQNWLYPEYKYILRIIWSKQLLCNNLLLYKILVSQC